MTNNVIEKVLGDNAFYTSDYIKDTIKLVKSFLFKNDTEAGRYNDYLKLKYPTHKVDNDPRTWRYYRHLCGLTHELDKPITLTSIDNGDTFELNKASVLIHRRSRKELLEFGIYYDELVKRFPEQELYIKAVIYDSMYATLDEVVALENYTFTGYNKSLTEDNEHDLVFELQARVNNYKHIWLIPYYSLSSDLFLASQYNTLSYFILTSVLAIRLQNAKTSKAHGYHIRSYLASHHRLDEHLLFLNRKQQLFLYRNMLYLDNHAGRNSTFRTLIDVLFTERNISVVNYVQHQKNTVDEKGDTEYTYNQRLLNSKPLGYSQVDKGLEVIRDKEYNLAPGNAMAYDKGYEEIDRVNKLALSTTLLTKDLETILIDETDTVKYKLLDILTDYWAYMVKTNQMSFLVDYIDPVSNLVKRLHTKDLFKAYVICLFKSQGYDLQEFPEYRIKRVFKQTLPTRQQLTRFFYEKRIDYRAYLDEILQAVPRYRYISTSYEFSEFITSIYNLNIGLWELLGNYSDINTNAQMSLSVELMHNTHLYTFADETVDEFIGRVGIKDVRLYTPIQASGMVFSVLDNLFDQKLTYQNRLKLLQKHLGEVFFKFNSYTVQLINNYYSDNSIVAGFKDSRYLHKYAIKINSIDSINNLMGLGDYAHALELRALYKTKDTAFVWFDTEFSSDVKVHSAPVYNVVSQLEIEASFTAEASFNHSKTLLIDTENAGKTEEEVETTQVLNFYLDSVSLDSESTYDSRVDIQVASQHRVVIPREIGNSVGFSADYISTSILSSDPHSVFLAMNL